MTDTNIERVGIIILSLLLTWFVVVAIGPNLDNPTTNIDQPDDIDLIVIRGDQAVDQGHSSIVVDTVTGCQYIVLRSFRKSSRAAGITARLDSNGQPMCGLNDE